MVSFKMSYGAGALSSLGVERSFVKVGINLAHLGTSVVTGKTGSGFFMLIPKYYIPGKSFSPTVCRPYKKLNKYLNIDLSAAEFIFQKD